MSTTIGRVRVAKQIPGRPAASTTEAIAAKNAAESAQAAAEGARDTTLGYRNATEGFKADAQGAAGSASASAAATAADVVSVTALKNTAVGAAGTATTKAGEAANSAGAALGHANDANAERVLAQTARRGAEAAAGSADTSAGVSTSQAETATEAAESAALSAQGIALTANGGPFVNVEALAAALEEGESAFTRDGTAWIIDEGAPTVLFSFPAALKVQQLLDRFQSDIPLSDGMTFLFAALLNGAPMLRVLLDAARRESGMTELAGLLLLRSQILAMEDIPEDVVFRIAVRAGPDGVEQDYVLADWLVENGVPAMDVPQFSEATLRRIGGGLPIPELMFEGEAGSAGTALQVAEFNGQRYVWGAVVNSLTALPELVDEIELCLSAGQSNSENGGLDSTGNVATPDVVDRHRALMFPTGYLGTQGALVSEDVLGDFVPGVEIDSASAGESGGSSFLTKALADTDAIGLPNTILAYRTVGVSGQTIAYLSDTGGVPYQNLLTTVRAAKKTAARYRKKLALRDWNWTQGEAEPPERTRTEYRTALLAHEENVRRDTMAITGQAREPWMLLDVLASADGGLSDTGPRLGQVDSLNYRRPILPTLIPSHFNGAYGFNTGQQVHWKPTGKALLKRFRARTSRIGREGYMQMAFPRLAGWDADGVWLPASMIWRRIYNAGTGKWDWRYVPFEPSPRVDPTSFQISGNTITFTVLYAENGFEVWDELRGPATDHGFTWDGGETITGLAIGAGEIDIPVTLTFDGPPTPGGTLTCNVAEQDATNDGGPAVWCDLFDKCEEPSGAVDGLALRQSLLPFSIVVN